MPTVAKTAGNESANATASVLLDISPAPPTAMIFFTPAARARSMTAAASPAYSLPWMCAWLSISMRAPSFLVAGFDAWEQNFGWLDLVTGGKTLAPRRAQSVVVQCQEIAQRARR